MAETWKVIGPPGTGKTTYVVQQIARAVDALRHGRVVLASSLTRAAAIELKGRVVDRLPHVNGELRVGTLHSHAYHGLGCPEVFGDKNGSLSQWNDEVASKRPMYRLSTTGAEEDEPAKLEGDKAMQDYHLRRARLTPRSAWPTQTLAFAKAYEEFKKNNDLVDFSDMIDLAYTSVDCAPGIPQFIFVDEAQDHDRSQFRLILKWASRPEVEKLIVVGDPKQNLYQWRGSEPEAFHEIADDTHKRVLAKSYRVPRAVWEVASAISSRITDCPNDQYDPRDGDAGELETDALPFTKRESAGDVAGRALDEHPGESIMFLATCGYMLSPLISALREEGVPFHNPYKTDNNRFNPLARRGKGKKTATDRILAFLAADQRGTWTHSELAAWTDACRVSDFLVRGAKADITRRAKKEPDIPASHDDLMRWFVPQELAAIAEGGASWLGKHLKLDKVSHYSYALRVLQKHGTDGLLEVPRVIVGTVHSVKGGEADVVYLSTDLSMAEREGFLVNENPIHRKFYVGATRARRKLVLCAPGISTYGAYEP